MLSTRDPTQNKRPTQSESGGLEKITPSKLTGEKNKIATHIRQNKLQNKNFCTTTENISKNEKGINYMGKYISQ